MEVKDLGQKRSKAEKVTSRAKRRRPQPPAIPSQTALSTEKPPAAQAASKEQDTPNQTGDIYWKPPSLLSRVGSVFRTRRVSHPAMSGLLSCVVHSIVLILLALLSFAVPDVRETWLQSPPNALDEIEDVALELSSELADTAVTQAQASIQPDEVVEPPQNRLPLGIDTTTSPLGTMQQGTVGGRGSRGPLREIQQLGTELSNESRFRRQGEKSKGSANFFGVQANGDAFVYVVDSSRSMSGRKWQRAVNELCRSIGELEEGQLFYVIFFDMETRPMMGERFPDMSFMDANPENLKRFRNWAENIRLGRETFPKESMQLALFLRPDAIFLLSDGEFHDDTVNYLAEANGVKPATEVLEDEAKTETKESDQQYGIEIHTICFESLVGQSLLKQISNDSGGVFRYVP